AALCAVPGVAARTEYRRTVVPMRTAANANEQEIDVVGVQPTRRWTASFPLLQGDDARGRAAIAAGDGAWISEPMAFRRGLRVGDVLTIRGSDGPVTLPIAAIYRDYSNERGEVIVGASWLQQHLRAPVTALSFEAAAGVDVEPLAATLRAAAATADTQAVSVRVQGELRSSSLQVFDRTFAITGVMRLLCLCVAFVGIYAAFAALQLERAGEIGLLRCLGARPRQIGLVVLGQTALLGLCAGLLALPLGVLLGHVLAHVINRVSFGWTLVTVSVPWSALGEVLVLAIVAATLAGLQPAWRFARMRPAEGLREA
ncbi:MAG: ABC transporter permease, partial [Planctomycetota bacterium]